jgi:predicted permease
MLGQLRFTWRTFRRNPGFVAVAVGSLALGIGANTAVFSLFDQVLLRSLPVAGPERLVLFHTEGQDPGWAMADNFAKVYSYPNYKDFRDRSEVFDGVAARAGASATVMESGGAANASVELVSGNFFQVLGVRANMGRTILPSDDATPGAHPVVVLSHGYWTRRLGGNPAALNSRIVVNGHPMEVIGILDRRFLGIQSGQTPDLYVPIAMKGQISPGWSAFGDISGRWLNIFARVKADVPVETAQAATRVLFQAIRAENLPHIRPMQPRERDEYLRRTVDLRPAAQGINMLSEFWRKPLRVLMAMVGLVLLIACANLANLLIARAAARRKEIAVRMAVGGSRFAILRQLLGESLALTLAGGLVGLLIAKWAVAGLLHLISETGETGWLAASLDWRLFGYTMAVAVAAGLVFGCAPLLETWRVDVVSALKEQAASSSRQRARKALVALQLALALVLLAGAGLFARTLMNLKRTDPGFQAAGVMTFALQPRLVGYDETRAAALLRGVRERLETMPGVETVAFAGLGPYGGGRRASSLHVEGYSAAPDEDPGAEHDSASPGFFRTLRIPIAAGREFDERDNAAGPKVAVINEALANKYFRGRNPLGMRLGPDRKMEYQVIGVARDIRPASLREAAEPFLWFAHEQRPSDRTVVYIRGEGRDLGGAARGVVREIDAGLPVTDMKTLQARVDESMFAERSVAALAAAFGFLATVLAAVGLYGVVAYSVARRTVEIGVRMALGASPARIYGLVLKEIGVLVLAGAALGLPAAFALGRLVESQLFGVKAHDPLPMAAALAALAVVALAAAAAPARRAARIDPLRALRAE